MTEDLLVMRAPSANRVFTASAGPLAVREARWVLGAHLGAPVDVRERRIAGVDYLEVRTPTARENRTDKDPAPTSPAGSAASGVPRDVGALVAMLSSTFAAFERAEAAGESLLRPRALPEVMTHGSELETILRYPGKTNEQFTALLLNLAAALSSRREGLLRGDLSLLDPTCGRGTTLSRALRLGLSPTGADIDAKDIDAYRTFLTTWAKQHHLPHTQSSGRLGLRSASGGQGSDSARVKADAGRGKARGGRGKASGGRGAGSRWDLELAADRRAQRAGDVQRLHLLTCDTTLLADVLPDRSVDALVADLPYGVQHGARTEGWQRSPLDLLELAMPAWRTLLRSGGGMALALNRRTAPYERVREILGSHGLTVLSADGAFRHRVDQAIDRDVVLAVPDDHPQLSLLRSLAASVEEPTDTEAATTEPPARAEPHGPRERTSHE